MRQPELDSLIAGKVFKLPMSEALGCRYKRVGYVGHLTEAPDNYSGNMAKAFEVIDKIKQMNLGIRTRFLQELHKEVEKDFPNISTSTFIIFHMEPKHICLAALKTMEKQ